MRTAFIIIAIFAAVVLLVRFAAPHAKPRFLPSERITQSALIEKIRALGKKCAVTEYGLGLNGSLKIRRVIDECKKNVAAGSAADWQYVLCNASDAVLHAYLDGKKDVRLSAYCGHVGKYPRVYLLCETLVSNLDCEITEDTLFNAISAFEENAPFSLSERKIICGMLKFCLLGHLYTIAESALKRKKEYDKGVADGKDGRVDLDYIHGEDYICGLIDGFSDSERHSIMRLLEYNEIDLDCAKCSCRKFLAKIYVTVNSVIQSLRCIDECKGKVYTPSKSVGVKSRRYAKVFNFLFPALIAVYAVFTCIFDSTRYVALFSVASIITYVVMRVPVLLYSPPRGTDIFTPIEKLLHRLFNSKKNVQNTDKLFMSETAYFGSEPEYLESTIDGGLHVCCDNRGGISIAHGATVDALYVGIESDGTTINLSECDGAVERHRATYRISKDNIELSAEVIAPIDCAACVVKLTVINRCATDKLVKIIGAAVRNKPVGQNCNTKNITGGAMAFCDNGFALSVGQNGEYGGELSAFCDNRILKHGRADKPALVGVSTLSVKCFSRAVTQLAVVYTSSRTEAESMFRHVYEPLFFSRAVVGSAVYSKLNSSNILPKSSGATVERTHNKCAAFPPSRLTKRDLSYTFPFGGITDGGDIVIDNDLYRPIDNIVANGQFCLCLNRYGIQSISLGGVGITAHADKYLHTPRAFVVIGENGVIWSPTAKPIGGGEMRTVHSRGYTEYTCAYNGTVCIQRCFAAVGSSVIVDITLQNKTEVNRKFDVMFSAICDNGINVAQSDLGVTAELGKNKLLFYAIDSSPEYALYKEGYFVYGKIDRACGFRSGGSTPAPTVSVCKTVKANGSARVVFCIADNSGVQRLASLKAVDELFDGVKQFYARLGRVLPNTDDGILNLSYLQSLYSAYGAFVAKRSMSLFAESLVLSAAKHVDSIGVKNRIFEILSCQEHTGELDDYSGCLQFLYCVIEYAEFMQSGEFWNEVLPYAPYNSRGKRIIANDTVYNHILRAVKSIIISPMPQYGIVQSLWQYKNLICVLRFFEHKIKPDSYLFESYKKCFAYAAEMYSRQAKRFTDNNFFDFKSVTEAYMCAKLLFDLDLNEKAYNIIKFNNPIERQLHYGDRADIATFDYFADSSAAAVYYLAVTERLFGVKFREKTVKICPHTAQNIPRLAFDILGKTKDIHITVDNSEQVGNWKMRVNRINYPADRVDLGEMGDDIVFYRDGNE